MRTTVVVLDALVYVPALFMFSRTWHASRSNRTQVFRVVFLILHVLRYYWFLQELAFLTLILQPALLLIDFGHFQYNSVMLGKFTITFHDD
jgi:alpha-1,3-glucosyltransferase